VNRVLLRSVIHGNGHTRRDKDWAVGDSFPGLIPAEGKDSGGSVAIFELDVPAGAKVPIAHSHDAYEETIYGIEGVITFTLEGRKIEIGPGDALCIPRYPTGSGPPLRQPSPRHIQNAGNRHPGILTPDYFREIATIAKAAATSVPQVSPDPKALAEVMHRHGLTPVP
jgi:mannose-6-phosphate isomerase-like protein (cupin superfamily)